MFWHKADYSISSWKSLWGFRNTSYPGSTHTVSFPRSLSQSCLFVTNCNILRVSQFSAEPGKDSWCPHSIFVCGENPFKTTGSPRLWCRLNIGVEHHRLSFWFGGQWRLRSRDSGRFQNRKSTVWRIETQAPYPLLPCTWGWREPSEAEFPANVAPCLKCSSDRLRETVGSTLEAPYLTRLGCFLSGSAVTGTEPSLESCPSLMPWATSA